MPFTVLFDDEDAGYLEQDLEELASLVEEFNDAGGQLFTVKQIEACPSIMPVAKLAIRFPFLASLLASIYDHQQFVGFKREREEIMAFIQRGIEERRESERERGND